MKSKSLIIIGIVVALLIGVIVYFVVTEEEAYFDKVNLPDRFLVVNRTDYTYIDTIVKVGLNELDVTPQVVVIREMNSTTTPPPNNGMETQAYIIGEDGQYLIFVKKMSRRDAMTILSHELYHLKQYEDGTLYMNVEENYITWKGKRYDYTTLPPYFDREWEQEAEKEGLLLKKKLKGILYGE